MEMSCCWLLFIFTAWLAGYRGFPLFLFRHGKKCFEWWCSYRFWWRAGANIRTVAECHLWVGKWRSEMRERRVRWWRLRWRWRHKLGHSSTHQPRNASSRDAVTDFGVGPAQIVVLLHNATFELENDGPKWERDALDDEDGDGYINWATWALTSQEKLRVVMQL